MYPDKDFRFIGFEEPYPEADCYLFCNVLLHVTDEELPSIARRLEGKRKVIVEVMNPEYRNGRIHFHRKPDDYALIFGSCHRFTLPYRRYDDHYTFLLFDE